MRSAIKVVFSCLADGPRRDSIGGCSYALGFYFRCDRGSYVIAENLYSEVFEMELDCERFFLRRNVGSVLILLMESIS